MIEFDEQERISFDQFFNHPVIQNDTSNSNKPNIKKP